MLAESIGCPPKNRIESVSQILFIVNEQKINMKKLFRKIIVCAVGIFLVAGLGACRSYNDRLWKTVDFVSTPDQATVFIDGKNCGLTPTTLRLSRSRSYEVRFSKPGFFDEDCLLETFTREDGSKDILDSIEIALVKITPESVAERERLARERATDGTGAGTSASARGNAEGPSPAAVEFSKLGKPSNFTEFRLREKTLKRLLSSGEITEDEFRKLHEELYSSYNENRLLKAPRLDTYEKAR